MTSCDGHEWPWVTPTLSSDPMTTPAEGWSFTLLGSIDLIPPSWFPGTTSTEEKTSSRVSKNQGSTLQSMSSTFPIECFTSPRTMILFALYLSAIEFTRSIIFIE